MQFQRAKPFEREEQRATRILLSCTAPCTRCSTISLQLTIEIKTVMTSQGQFSKITFGLDFLTRSLSIELLHGSP